MPAPRSRRPKTYVAEPAWTFGGLSNRGALQPGCSAFGLRFFQSARPLGGLLFSFRLSDSLSLLNLSDQMILLSGESLQVIVCEFASALPRGPGKLFPLAFDLIPIHVGYP